MFCYLFAKHHGGSFILRVEDTDEARNTDEARRAIFDGLRWLGLTWDEGPDIGGDFGPYNQSERGAIYDRYFQQLRVSGRVYEEDGAWRFRFERKPVKMLDLVCGEVTIDYTDASNTPDMVIRRSDGSYVFHFVNVVDDLEMQITHVIRGEDHLMNTPKHLQLIEALGGTAPAYAHIPLILNPNGSKMSKRDEGAAVADYPRRGFVPTAVVNFLALLGWSPKSEEEIFSLEELVARFSLEAVNRAPARFDGEKCAWVNQQHLLRMGLEEFVELALPIAQAAGLPVEKDFAAAMALVKDKVRLLDELPEAAGFLLKEDFSRDPAAEAKARGQAIVATAIPALAAAFGHLESWSGEAAKTALAEVAASLEVKPGSLMFPLRVALSGRSGGPDIAAIMEYLGREACVSRLETFAQGSL